MIQLVSRKLRRARRESNDPWSQMVVLDAFARMAATPQCRNDYNYAGIALPVGSMVSEAVIGLAEERQSRVC